MTPTLDSFIRSLQARLILKLDRDVSYTEVLNFLLRASLVQQAERSSVEDEEKAIFKKQLDDEMAKLVQCLTNGLTLDGPRGMLAA